MTIQFHQVAGGTEVKKMFDYLTLPLILTSKVDFGTVRVQIILGTKNWTNLFGLHGLHKKLSA